MFLFHIISSKIVQVEINSKGGMHEAQNVCICKLVVVDVVAVCLKNRKVINTSNLCWHLSEISKNA